MSIARMTLSVVLASGMAVAMAEPRIEVLAVEREDGPAGFDQYQGFAAPVISDGGRIVFRSRLGTSASTSDPGLVAVDATDVSVLAIQNQPAPDGLGPFSDLTPGAEVNARGDVVFQASISSNGPDSGVYFIDGVTGEVSALASEGSPSPAGGLFGDFALPSGFPELHALNDSGEIAFVETIFGDGVTSPTDSAIFTSGPGGQAAVIREGDALPSFRNGAATLGSSTEVTINNAGEVAFAGFLRDLSFDAGIFVATGGGIERRASIDAPAPVEGRFDSFSPIRNVPINDAGDVAFRASIERDGASNTTSVFRMGPSGDVRIATFADQLPDGSDVVRTARRSVAINNRGEVALVSGQSASVNLLVGDGSTLRLITREDLPAPGGGVYDGVNEFALNDAGDIAFLATNVENGERRRALYLSRENGEAERIVRVGDLVDGRTVSNIVFRGVSASTDTTRNSDGFADDGSVVFLLRTTSGIDMVCAYREATVGFNAADLAEPFERLELGDVVAFLQRFGAEDPAADLAEPFGRFELGDVVAFLQIFGVGCP